MRIVEGYRFMRRRQFDNQCGILILPKRVKRDLDYLFESGQIRGSVAMRFAACRI
jgi:hypothetical protein